MTVSPFSAQNRAPEVEASLIERANAATGDLRSMTFGFCGVRHELGWPGRPVPPRMCDTEQLLDCAHSTNKHLHAALLCARELGILNSEEASRVRAVITFLTDGYYLLDLLAHDFGNLHHDRVNQIPFRIEAHEKLLQRENIPGSFNTVAHSDMSVRVDSEQRVLGAIRGSLVAALATTIEEFVTTGAQPGQPLKAKDIFLQRLAESETKVYELGLEF